MLHDLIMRHKASLQMFGDICHLVNKYTLSQDFSIHTKLQCQKSFLRYMEGSHRTHLLQSTNCNVTLHDGKTVTVPVFDMKEMLISILADKTLMSNTNFAEGYKVLTGDVDNNNPTGLREEDGPFPPSHPLPHPFPSLHSTPLLLGHLRR